MAKKTPPERMSEIASWYQAGWSTTQLRAAFSAGIGTISRAVSEAGLELRGIPPASVQGYSEARLRELYWGLDSGLPSMDELARQLGCSSSSLRHRMGELGIVIRTRAEQSKIEYKRRGGDGRWLLDARRPVSEWSELRQERHRKRMSEMRASSRTKRAKQKRRESLAVELIDVHCSWCGCPLKRKRSQKRQSPTSACCFSHRSKHTRHNQCYPDAPRPLIVEKLRTLWEQDRRRSLNGPTLDLLEKLGESLGAREAEYWAVLEEWRA